MELRVCSPRSLADRGYIIINHQRSHFDTVQYLGYHVTQKRTKVGTSVTLFADEAQAVRKMSACAAPGASSGKSGRFEWICSWEQLSPHLATLPLPTRPHGARALDIGCGTSTVALELRQLSGVGCVTAVDRESGCIAHMRATYGEPSGLRWRVHDLIGPGVLAETLSGSGEAPQQGGEAPQQGGEALQQGGEALQQGGEAPQQGGEALQQGGEALEHAELILDKGTLDCALVEGHGARLLCEVRKLLVVGGVYAVISFREIDQLTRLLECEALGWEVEARHELPATRGPPGCLCIVRAATPCTTSTNHTYTKNPSTTWTSTTSATTSAALGEADETGPDGTLHMKTGDAFLL